MSNSLPMFKYPTSTVIIDDDSVFLKTLSQEIANSNLIKTFSKSNDGVKYIDKHSNAHLFNIQYFKILDNEHSSEIKISIKYGKIHEEINNFEKYNNVSTVIIDYDMPETDGLSLCKSLNNNLYKVLLTSVATDAEVIEAFNNKIIDAYIPKSHPDLISTIKKIINQAEEYYFNKLSDPIIKALKLHPNLPCYLTDSNYIDFLLNFIQEKDVNEYYIIDSMGSCLLKTRNGSTYKLIINDEDEFLSILESIPDNIDAKIIEQLNKREILIYNDNINNKATSKQDIYSNIHRCKKILNTNLYYSLVPSS